MNVSCVERGFLRRLKRLSNTGTLLNVYEIWQYEMTQYDPRVRKGDIFEEYINEFFAQKTMASGYSPDCITDRDKDQYMRKLEFTEGIRMNKNAIQHNAGFDQLQNYV